ncbi:MAG: MvaI/BcnI family restriction endonuclease [Caldilineaceae bacterium]|nr:MvaI/BcnI family restriction endonuclease [Caldilineaceae bacterium]
MRAHGPQVMPEESHYNGSGAPGVFPEDLLGATAGGHDIPDAVGWELKWHSDRTSLVALFHKSPDGPEAILRFMVRRYGRKEVQGRSIPTYHPGAF